MATIADRLTRVWETPHNLAGQLTTVDHKVIGSRYVWTAYAFFVLAGIQALAMRTQLATPANTLVDPALYNKLFTMHGTTMIFWFATPMLSGFGNYLVPLLIGSRDMAFPRLNAFSYWVFLFSGLFLYSSYLTGAMPDAGWFNYVPLAGAVFSPGRNIDYYALGLIFLGIASTAGAINFIVTIFKLRAPGMSINRMPLFLWALLATSFSIVFAIPPLNAALGLLELDRKFGTHFFDPVGGGSPLLWQHLFWIFGHPDVYIIFLPAVGIVSMIVPVFSRRPIVGYTFVVLATVATAIIAFGVWVHHMFATGLAVLAASFFGAASMIITIPSGVQIFAWIATIWNGRPLMRPPFFFILGFVINFILGGLTGVMFGAVPFDWQVTDSYFVVAHFHYVLIGGAVFPIFAALHYWLPKMTGRMLDERLGKWTFWLIFLGFNLAFFPQHIVGLLGMPRRVYTYPAGFGWEPYNLASTIGAFVLALGVLLFVANFLRSQTHGEPAGDNPWHANTLEWATSSPPPPYNFRVIPTVTSRDPLWEQTPEELFGATAAAGDTVAAPGESHSRRRETLGTTVLDADAEEVLPMPEESFWPPLLALSLLIIFVGVLVDLYALAALGALFAFGSIVGWLWPKQPELVQRGGDAA